MKIKLRIWLFLILLIIIPLQPLLAQEGDEKPETEPVKVTYYTLGQQSLCISAGLFIPLFLQAFTGEVESTNLSLGGVGSLYWGAHLDNHWLIGLEVGGMFCKSVMDNLLLMLPITAKGSYIIHIYPFEIPISLGIGINIMKYESQEHLNFMLKPGFSTLWKYNSSWAFGLNVAYWWILQPWSEDTSKSRMGNFLETTLSAQYSF